MKAQVIVEHGLYPLGGTVDGVDQMNEHHDPKNELKGGDKVVIAKREEAVVTTWGGHYNAAKMKVVEIVGKNGWYLASGFHS